MLYWSLLPYDLTSDHRLSVKCQPNATPSLLMVFGYIYLRKIKGHVTEKLFELSQKRMSNESGEFNLAQLIR